MVTVMLVGDIINRFFVDGRLRYVGEFLFH